MVRELAPREREVLGLMESGLRTKQIALQLGIGEHTVKVHKMHIRWKLGSSASAHPVAGNLGGLVNRGLSQ